ncbi:MAG: cysteine--tRNA ligase [Eubacteriales bacterium]|nr:cysteine--tRNA ligase [Eubacteriales bacterium]
MWIYNSAHRRKEEFKPLQEGKVGIYACGPTVYNYFHIGNARPFITFDVLRRQLEREGYDVTFVQNFTDIDDKMIKRANEEGITVKELGEKFIAEYYKDAGALGIRPATVHPKATEHIPEIIALVQKLIDGGHAYATPAGDVYYRVESFPGYGKLSGQSVEDREMGASERLDVETDKENPADFALWKSQKPGEPAWESPWGMGRPGWHIECSAMSMKYLGETFDIHCGGKDLLFPHHENEIAQSEGATGHPYVRYWMHNGFINVDNQKMSKSLGNFFTVRDIAKEYDLEAVRLFMLSAHYRSPINFSREQIAAAHASLTRLYTARDQMKFLLASAKDAPMTGEEQELVQRIKGYEKRFDEAMDDDLNTADAIGAIFELVKDANVSLTSSSSRAAVEAALNSFKALTDVLGLVQKSEDALPADIQAMVDERAAARKAKDWKRSDELRDAIKAAGYILEDSREGQKVRKAL